jgi:uncharacterized protein YbcC (UPF0753/DUF2309 family)
MASSLTTRPRLRVDLDLAARRIPASRPLDGFVTINPLRDLEDRSFGDALAAAGAVLGVRGLLSDDEYRDLYAAGRIRPRDLRLAIARRCTSLLVAAPVVVGGRTITTEELLLADLLEGPSAPAPGRTARTLVELVDERSGSDLAGLVDHHVATWCGLSFGGLAPAAGDGRRSLWSSWRAAAAHDAGLRSLGGRAAARAAAALPASAEEAATVLLERLAIPVDHHRGHLLAHLSRLPGWSSVFARDPDELLGYVTVRLAYEHAAVDGHPAVAAARVALLAGPTTEVPGPGPEVRAAALVVHLLGAARTEPVTGAVAQIAHRLARFPVEERGLVWQEALELGHRARFVGRLAGAHVPPVVDRPRAQIVCCIDPRSEGLRRHLEEAQDLETIGFAGFFGLPVAVQTLERDHPVQACPIILDPRITVAEHVMVEQTGARALRRNDAAAEVGGAAGEAYHAAAHQPSAFSMAEAGGVFSGVVAACRTLAPSTVARLRRSVRSRVRPELPTGLTLPDADPAVAAGLLRAMGLVRGFGRLVVLCGHASRHENNPFRAALNCGACAGNAGGPNARLAADLLNRAEVRAGLVEHGIVVPEDTWFVAAEHETTTDRVSVLDRAHIPSSHLGDLRSLEADLERAGSALAAERLPMLPGTGGDPASAHAAVARRAVDWGQVVPEWGLAGNAALLVAPRRSSRGVDLGRRAFLHSYEPDLDPEGRILEAILTGPLVVAQWINSQYYFSVTDPDVLGAGSKTRHNVVAGTAVLDGPGGDVRLGLPLESVSDGRRLVHEPLRLLVAVEAPLARIDEVLAHNPTVARLVANGWIALIAREGAGEPWYERTPGGTWSLDLSEDPEMRSPLDLGQPLDLGEPRDRGEEA